MSHDVQLTPAASHSPAATPPNLELPHDNPDDHENTHVTGSITYSSLTGSWLAMARSFHRQARTPPGAVPCLRRDHRRTSGQAAGT